MEIGDKIKNFFSSFKGESFDEKDMVEFRKGKVELLKSEISDIVSKIDENESIYSGMIKSTKDSIEKGADVDPILEHIEIRYKKRESELIKSLGSKKSELNRHQFKLNEILEKAKKPQNYADSIVCNAKGEILLLLRGYNNDFQPNTWGLPGGKIEQGENEKDAALRELKEETSLDAESAHEVKSKQIEDGGRICYYKAYVDENKVDWIALDNDEHVNYTFMSIEEIKKRPNTDFVLDLKETLLNIVDPQHVHMGTLSKAHENGMIDDIIFERAKEKYSKFSFEKAHPQ